MKIGIREIGLRLLALSIQLDFRMLVEVSCALYVAGRRKVLVPMKSLHHGPVVITFEGAKRAE